MFGGLEALLRVVSGSHHTLGLPPRPSGGVWPDLILRSAWSPVVTPVHCPSRRAISGGTVDVLLAYDNTNQSKADQQVLFNPRVYGLQCKDCAPKIGHNCGVDVVGSWLPSPS